jgi:serine/threonine protein kinase
MNGKLLGKGTYGSVFQSGNTAVKKFHDMGSLIQEYAAGKYLNDSPYTVNVYGCDLQELTLTMKLYMGTLRDWLTPKRTDSQRSVAFKGILQSLTFFGDLYLVHGDLKPGNILCNWDEDGNITDIVLGDLGFVCIERFAKAHRTAPAYIETVIEKDHKHDIYSLGVIALQIFGKFRVKIRYNEEQLRQLSIDRIPEGDIREHIISCFNENRTLRPTARYLLYNIYGERPNVVECILPTSLQTIIERSEVPASTINEKKKELKSKFKTFGNEKLGIRRCKLAYDTCLSILIMEGIPYKYYNVYACATLAIYSAIFGRIGYTVQRASKDSNVELVRILRIIDVLINHLEFLGATFFANTS